MLLFCQKVYDRKLSGIESDYIGPEWYELLATATTYFCSLRTTQGSGTSPKVTVYLEHSNDTVNWEVKSTLFFKQIVPSDGINVFYANDSSGITGAFARLQIQLSGTDPAGHVAIHLCGRGRPPAHRSPMRRSR